MSAKSLHSECPHCRAKLQIDPLSGEVLNFDPPPEDLGKAAREVEKRGQKSREDAFDAALRAENSREKDLDSLFRDASEKQGQAPNEERVDNPLDDRWR
jgi:hypothetical protein